ncbi:MAG: CidA/LrgA family protein [Lachnospiraceae bacterium]|nr:CidA/LrgA family protein [Lachnospiraceae bacterium]
MKYLRQITILLIFSVVGELLNILIPLPVPGSVYGMVLLFIALMTGIVKLSQVEETAKFMISIMPIFFISPTVSIMTSMGGMKGQILALIIICVISTSVVLMITGRVAQFVMQEQKRRKQKEESVNE